MTDLSTDDIQALWERYGGAWSPARGAHIVCSTEHFTAFCRDLITMARGELTPHDLDTRDIRGLYQHFRDLSDLSRAKEDAEYRVIEALKVRLNRPLAMLVLVDWDCLDSPTGQCVLDLDIRNPDDENECIFCHHPHEEE